MQGPETFLNDLGIEMACAVDPARKAVLDAPHRIFLNWETYYVSSEDALARFLASPQEYCGLITDPVTRERFQPEAGSPRREHGGRVFLFSSDSTAETFDSAPDEYTAPMLAMVPVSK